MSRLSIRPQSFQPEQHQIYRYSNYVMLLLNSGDGLFQIDFRNYHAFQNRAIFLAAGQYFQLLQGRLDFTVIEFPPEVVLSNADSRFLFRHLLSLGYIELPGSLTKSEHTREDILRDGPQALDFSIRQWQLQNPFQTSPAETRLIFDLKEAIDNHFQDHPTVPGLLSRLHGHRNNLNYLLKKRLGITAGALLQNKVLLEARREIAFSDSSMKEITYRLGFNDPAYFNRFFKRLTGQTPGQFREQFEYHERDSFVEDLLAAIDLHFKENRSSAFYADQLGMSIKTLSKKVKQKLQLTVGELVRGKLVTHGKQMLQGDYTVADIAYELGFQEANHFSAFFKIHTGKTPSQFRHFFQKVQ